MRRVVAVRVAVAFLLVGFLAGGCGDGKGAHQAVSSAPASVQSVAPVAPSVSVVGTGSAVDGAGDIWEDGVPAAASSATLGSTGSGCVLPVTFDLARDWKPAAVEEGLGDQGRFTLSCEVDAKPAGRVGFLRVWTAKASDLDAKSAVQDFLKADRNVVEIVERPVPGARLKAVEATYLRDIPSLGVRKRERVLGVVTPTVHVVIVVSGLDTAQYEGMLPAYLLARNTVTLRK